jgi:hypothetical protein
MAESSASWKAISAKAAGILPERLEVALQPPSNEAVRTAFEAGAWT